MFECVLPGLFFSVYVCDFVCFLFQCVFNVFVCVCVCFCLRLVVGWLGGGVYFCVGWGEVGNGNLSLYVCFDVGVNVILCIFVYLCACVCASYFC